MGPSGRKLAGRIAAIMCLALVGCGGDETEHSEAPQMDESELAEQAATSATRWHHAFATRNRHPRCTAQWWSGLTCFFERPNGSTIAAISCPAWAPRGGNCTEDKRGTFCFVNEGIAGHTLYKCF